MSSAEPLAMKLDSDTNNTSLVLAFELPNADRSILLFAGDAQVGNWLSWGDQTYPREALTDPGAPRPEKIEDLLGRTVFYKVGHHGSHNATLEKRGLELMTSRHLVAAITVVEAVAKVQGKGRKEPGRGWQMPYRAMFARLNALTSGCVIKGDGDPAVERAAFEKVHEGVERPGIRHDERGLWVELLYPPGFRAPT